MSASQNPGLYLPMNNRVSHLRQVSEAASALAGTAVPRVFDDRVNAPLESNKGLSACSLLPVQRADSFCPDAPLPRSGQGNFKSKVRRPAVTLFAASMILLAAEEFTGSSAPRLSTRDGPVTTLSETVVEPSNPRLIVRAWYGSADDPAPLGLTVHGLTGEGIIHLTGLQPGMELSTGTAIGPYAWEIEVADLE